MIRPLKRSRVRWAIDWFDFPEPVLVPSLGEFCLPTCIVAVVDGSFEVLGTDLLREFDQRRCERLFSRLMDERATPDELIVPDDAGWDDRNWRAFADSCRCGLQFGPRDGRNVSALFDQVAAIKAAMATRLIRAAKANTRDAGGISEVAESLVRASRKMLSPERRKVHLERALEMEPKLGEARIELGDLLLEEGDVARADTEYHTALELLQPVWKDNGHLDFDQPEARTTLRAVYGLMMTAWQQGDYATAVTQAEWMLERNPRDNQGVRFFVPLLYLLGEQAEPALGFCEQYGVQYKGDFTEPGFLFGWGLVLMQSDKETEAAAKYRAGMAKNLHIVPTLLDLPEPSSEIWHANDRAEPSYAHDFAESFGVLWEREASWARHLRECYEAAWPQLENLWSVRQRMHELQDQRHDPEHDAVWEKIVAEEKAAVSALELAGTATS